MIPDRPASTVHSKIFPKEPSHVPVDEKRVPPPAIKKVQVKEPDSPDEEEERVNRFGFLKVLGVIFLLMGLAAGHFWHMSIVADSAYKTGLRDGMTSPQVDPNAIENKDQEIKNLKEEAASTRTSLESMTQQRDRLAQSLKEAQTLMTAKVNDAEGEMNRRIQAFTADAEKKSADLSNQLAAAQKEVREKDDQLNSARDSLVDMKAERDQALNAKASIEEQSRRNAAQAEAEIASVRDELAKALERQEQAVPAASVTQPGEKKLEEPADFTKALEANPNDVTARISRGNAHLIKGQYDEAIADYNKTIQLAPGLIQAYTARGSAYQAKGEFDAAMSDFDKAIKINPSDPFGYYRKGDIYFLQGNVSRAEKNWNRAIRLDSQNAFSKITYYYKGNHDEVIADNTKVIDVYPDYVLAYYMRGAAYGAKGNHDRAIEDLSKAIALNPQYIDAYNNRAIAYFFNRDYAKAQADVNKIKELGGEVNRDFLNSLVIAVAKTSGK